jgi:hypothetical protein
LSHAVQAADWLAEAFETGNALAPLPAAAAPRDCAEGRAIAAAVLDRLGMTACGVRVVLGPAGVVASGPVLEGRLLAPATPVLLGALRHASASAAILAVLAEKLDPDAGGPPAIAALHPAIDIAASRFRDAPGDVPSRLADLGGLGAIVVGRRWRPEADGPAPEEVSVTLSVPPRRGRPAPGHIAAALAEAAAAARRRGGLPAGAVLVAAGLCPRVEPPAQGRLAARLGTIGRVAAQFA